METRFQLTQDELNIPCTLTVPDFGQIQRIVLGVHGLAGSSQDVIQAGIAEEMELFSSAVMRFDLPCHGQNTADTDGFTLHNCVRTLLCVASHIREKFPQVEDLCIFATGFGAYVTLVALPKLLALPGKLKLVVQTPSVMMHETLLSMVRMNKDTFRAIDRITFPTKPPLTVTYSLYKELLDNVVLNTHPIPMLILHGEKDDYIKMEDIRNFHRANEQSKLVIIPGATHQFQEEGAWDMVLDLTRDWFAFEQVLLTDWD